MKQRVLKSSDKPVVFVDHRELDLLENLPEKKLDIKTKQLAVADVLVSDRLGIERKSVLDFLQSIIDGRLFKQMKELTDTFERPILIIEGDSLYDKRNIHPNAIKGAINAIALDFRVPILWTKDIHESSDLIVLLANREQREDKRDILIRGEKKPRTMSELQEYIICGFPFISSKMSKRILKKFKTIKKFINASETNLQKVEGIGKEKVKKIKELIEKEYK